MKQLNKRLLEILSLIQKRGSISNKEIKENLDDISRATIVRDIEFLIKGGLITREGKGRSVRYSEKIKNELLRYIDTEEYFKTPVDKREIAFESFDFEIFEKLKNIFTKEELGSLEQSNNDYRKRIKSLPDSILKKEFERLSIELSWKSSQIEGNTYSLLDTEILIKENKEAKGHKKEEAIMILNHKKALDYIMDKKSDFEKISLRKIENIQNLLVKDLGISKGLRENPVGIVGTKYKPLDNKYQLKEAIEKLVGIINNTKNPFSKALLAILMISYIQPFEDGNKRTGRLLGDALLLAYNVCPLSFRSVEESDYKKAVILFYEQNSMRFFKELFIQQFKFAVENYFLG
jgi:Fic family protein